MADGKDVTKTDAEVAYKLLETVARLEGRGLHPAENNPADRDYVLKTYAACIYAVTNPTYYL